MNVTCNHLCATELFDWLHEVPFAFDRDLREVIHLWGDDALTRVELKEEFRDDDADFALRIKVIFKRDDPRKVAELQALGFGWSAGFQTAMRFLASFEELAGFFGLLIVGWRMTGVLPASLAMAGAEQPAPLYWPLAA